MIKTDGVTKRIGFICAALVVVGLVLVRPDRHGETVTAADTGTAWSDCDAYARHISDDGKETVVVCSLGRHAAPGDTTEYHFDPDLEISWRYADEWASAEWSAA